MVERILIQRASEGSASGTIHHIGEAMLSTQRRVLGRRLLYTFGNGSPSPEVTDSPDTINTVVVGHTIYLCCPVRCPETNPMAIWEVTVKHDEVLTNVELIKDEEPKAMSDLDCLKEIQRSMAHRASSTGWHKFLRTIVDKQLGSPEAWRKS